MVAEAADVADVFFLGGRAKVFELDKRGEFGDRWGVIHTAASVPVRAEARSPPILKTTTTGSDERKGNSIPPPGPPRSGWVQPVTGADADWRSQSAFAGSVFWFGAAQFWSLGSIYAHAATDDSITEILWVVFYFPRCAFAGVVMSSFLLGTLGTCGGAVARCCVFWRSWPIGYFRCGSAFALVRKQ